MSKKEKKSKPNVTDADNRTVESGELQDKNDESIIDPSPSQGPIPTPSSVQKRKLRFKVPGRKKTKSCVPSEKKYIDSEDEIELHRSLTKELLHFAEDISDDEIRVMKHAIENLQHPNYRNMDAFLQAKDNYPSIALIGELLSTHSSCLDALLQWVTKKKIWTGMGLDIDFTQAIVATILFAFLKSIPLLEAKDVLYNIPTRKEVGELPLPELPRKPIVVYSTTLHPADIKSIAERREVHDQVRYLCGQTCI